MVTAVLSLDWFSQYSQTTLYGHPLNTDTSFPRGKGREGVFTQEANRDVPLDRVALIFTTGLAIMGVAFSVELLEWGRSFQILGVSRDSKWEDSRLKNQKVVVY